MVSCQTYLNVVSSCSCADCGKHSKLFARLPLLGLFDASSDRSEIFEKFRHFVSIQRWTYCFWSCCLCGMPLHLNKKSYSQWYGRVVGHELCSLKIAYHICLGASCLAVWRPQLCSHQAFALVLHGGPWIHGFLRTNCKERSGDYSSVSVCCMHRVTTGRSCYLHCAAWPYATNLDVTDCWTSKAVFQKCGIRLLCCDAQHAHRLP